MPNTIKITPETQAKYLKMAIESYTPEELAWLEEEKKKKETLQESKQDQLSQGADEL